jgi:DNA invertase Pin-like site-specific DNA recombinase
MGKAMFTIIGAMAELERNVIRERIVAGLEHARTRGTKPGRKNKYYQVVVPIA